jgi:hypothetical protein
VRDADGAGRAVAFHRDDRQRFQAMERERRQIGRGERLVALFGRDPSQRAETVAAGWGGRLSRDLEAVGVADRHRLDPAGAIDEHAEPPVQSMARLGQLFREIVGDDVVDRDAAAVKSLDAVFFGRRQP